MTFPVELNSVCSDGSWTLFPGINGTAIPKHTISLLKHRKFKHRRLPSAQKNSKTREPKQFSIHRGNRSIHSLVQNKTTQLPSPIHRSFQHTKHRMQSTWITRCSNDVKIEIHASTKKQSVRPCIAENKIKIIIRCLPKAAAADRIQTLAPHYAGPWTLCSRNTSPQYLDRKWKTRTRRSHLPK